MSHDFLFGTKPLPYFNLPDSKGQEISSWDFRQRCPPVVTVVHGLDCKDCKNWLKTSRELDERIQQIKGELLIIIPTPVDGLVSLQRHLRNAASLLADPDESYRQKLAAAHLAGTKPVVLIVDRYGDIAEVFEADAAHAFPDPRQILEALEFVELQCPE
ncbi:peroxiredoxin family protein [candidate division KSB1 bacterium]|nr:peroxiredoxin family protein [candidate division KSB1 bacterium]